METNTGNIFTYGVQRDDWVEVQSDLDRAARSFNEQATEGLSVRYTRAWSRPLEGENAGADGLNTGRWFDGTLTWRGTEYHFFKASRHNLDSIIKQIDAPALNKQTRRNSADHEGRFNRTKGVPSRSDEERQQLAVQIVDAEIKRMADHLKTYCTEEQVRAAINTEAIETEVFCTLRMQDQEAEQKALRKKPKTHAAPSKLIVQYVKEFAETCNALKFRGMGEEEAMAIASAEFKEKLNRAGII